MVGLETIMSVVAEGTGIKAERIIGWCRIDDYQIPRNLFCYVAYEQGHTLKPIGRYLNGRKHMTIMSNKSKAYDIIYIDAYWRKIYETIKEKLLNFELAGVE